MKVDVYNLKGEKSSTVELPDEIFAAKVNVDLMHQAYQRQMANLRLGTHNTKRRGEVRGGGRKPWRQKGTGRARQGSTNAAQWVGGGRIHTPKPRDYTQAMPQKMRRAALRSALTVKASNEAIVMVSDLALPNNKTAEMAKAIKAVAGDVRTLVLLPGKTEEAVAAYKSGRNLEGSKMLQASYLNVRDLLYAEKVIIPLASLEVIKSYLG
ncbi:MAG: 50S ribosomal protein L4 [Anaerolineaceae bacterium]|jgi:large subunit ribosomal protein L4